jgi:uncharacterized lipoprotein YmbA
MDRFRTSLIMMALACLALTACANLSARSDPSRFFTLTPVTLAQETSTRGPSNPGQLSLGIGPIKFPGYLDREQIVTRVSQHRFDLSENDRWAEPLEENFTRVLSQNLSVLLHTDRIVRYPWQTSHRPAYQVEIEVLRFEPNRSQEAQLAARWAVMDTSTKRLISARESRLTRQARAQSTEATVAALSETLGELSLEIADAVRAAGGQRTQ